MDPRIADIRSCANYLLDERHQGHELACLVRAVHLALEVCADILAAHRREPPRGYKDAVDKMVACGALEPRLGERLAKLFDVTDRLPNAWSTVTPHEFLRARTEGAGALISFCAVAERALGEAQHPAP